MYINRYCSIFSLHYSIRMKAKARLPHGQIPAGKQLLYCIFTHDSSYFQYCYCSKNKHSFKKLNLTIYIQFRYTFSWPKKRKIQFNNQKKKKEMFCQDRYIFLSLLIRPIFYNIHIDLGYFPCIYASLLIFFILF